MTATTAFALRTSDTAWIARNRAVPAESGLVLVQVPAGKVEKITLRGKPWLRHSFADVPRDIPNRVIVCPAEWAEDPAVTARRPQALDGKALFLAKARAEGSLR